MFSLPPLAAEIIFHIGSFPITNTVITGWVVVLLFAVFGFFLNRGVTQHYKGDKSPKGLVNFFESILEVILSYIDGVTKDRKKTLKFLPIVGSLFLFIVCSNWLGILPGVGSIGLYHGGDFTPLFRSANSDLNLTLAMAVLVIVTTQFLGIAAIGFFKYANKFIKLGDLWQAVKTGKFMNILVAIVEFCVGFVEIVSQIVAPMISLSLRLFGNIFAGEVLLTVLGSLIAGYGAFGIPLPFMALELLVGVIQALVFSMLSLVYLTIATTDVHGHSEVQESAGKPDIDVTMHV